MGRPSCAGNAGRSRDARSPDAAPSFALKSADAALVEEAEVILNEIGARGMLEFRDLLPQRRP